MATYIKIEDVKSVIEAAVPITDNRTRIRLNDGIDLLTEMPYRDRKKRIEKCDGCPYKLDIERRLDDVHIDWLNCSESCMNNLEYYLKHKERGRRNWW